jgi:hypothetical protein
MLVLFIKVVGCGFHGAWGVPKRIGGQSRENNFLFLKSGAHLSSVLRLRGFENAPKDKAEETEAKHRGRHKREVTKGETKRETKMGRDRMQDKY